MYAVRVGKEVGIFETWEETSEKVIGFSGAEYKKVSSKQEGLDFINGVQDLLLGLFIDGSYNSKTDSYGYAVVSNIPENHFIEFGPVPINFRKSGNVGAELWAALRAAKLISSGEVATKNLMFDYEGIEKFVNEWVPKTDLTRCYQQQINTILNNVDIKFYKVQAHSGNTFNNLADTYATRGSIEDVPRTVTW